MPIPWGTVLKAISDWVEGTDQGVASVWRKQGGSYGVADTADGYPFFSLVPVSLRSLGSVPEVRQRWRWPDQGSEQPWGDEVWGEGPGAFEELEIYARDQVAFVVSVQAYAAQADIIGQASATSLITRARARLALPGVRQQLREAGLSVWDRGDVQEPEVPFQTGYESRAAMDITFGIVEDVSEFTTYIDRVEFTLDFGGAMPPFRFEEATG